MPFPVGGRPSIPPTATVNCRDTILDQATGTTCLYASTIPALGMLFPISTEWFVSVGGDVGIGTTTPAAKLEVAGTARVTDTLTLNPSGDQALDVSTGSIYKGGTLFLHTRGGIENTAIGFDSLAVAMGTGNTACGYHALASMEGTDNTAVGARALSAGTSSFGNTAVGVSALQYGEGGGNTAVGIDAMQFAGTGGFNVAVGVQALRNNTEGSNNTASGTSSLDANTTGDGNAAYGADTLYNNLTGSSNTAVGSAALSLNTTGSSNIALGANAGSDLTIGSNNIAIGNLGVAGESSTIRIGTGSTHTRTFVAGVRGVTTGAANAIAVMVDSNGQLGTVSSSRRFKTDIADMGERTGRLLELRPVVFRYVQEQTLPNGAEVPLEYGLIAEDVAEVFPDLVVNDDEGRPVTVKYHLLSAMLLNELKREVREREMLHDRLLAQQETHVREVAELRSRLEALEARITLLCSTEASSRGR